MLRWFSLYRNIVEISYRFSWFLIKYHSERFPKLIKDQFKNQLPWLIWIFLIHGYIWGCVESLTFSGVVGAPPAGFSSSRGEAFDAQSRLISSVPPLELEHGVVTEFFTPRWWGWVSETGDSLDTEEHGTGSGGGERGDVLVVFAGWLYLTDSTEAAVAEWSSEYPRVLSLPTKCPVPSRPTVRSIPL